MAAKKRTRAKKRIARKHKGEYYADYDKETGRCHVFHSEKPHVMYGYFTSIDAAEKSAKFFNRKK
jgi:hypothetical protein